MTDRRENPEVAEEPRGVIAWLIGVCLHQKLVVVMAVLFVIGWGVSVAPFDWDVPWLQRRPINVDAIPDLGDNQQIVFTTWSGHSPQDVQDQITYPLSSALLGVGGVKTIRSQSMFGFSSIIVIFNEDVEYYWSRSRLLEKLNSLPPGTLPADTRPALGPDATALGQVFWYTLEGRDPDGRPVGGWDPQELRTIQDFRVRYALLASEGVSEVASVGGFVREYQIDVDPDAMRAAGVTLEQVFNAVRMSNTDVGARTIEINRAEYFVRGLGLVESLEDLGQAVVKVQDNVPITIDHVASVTMGPAERRGALDKAGAEAVGGVVVSRYGQNPLQTVHRIKEQIERIAPGLPVKAVLDWEAVTPGEVRGFAEGVGFKPFAGESTQLDQEAWMRWLRQAPRDDWPAWVTTSQVTVVPFYDRSILIGETLDTLSHALSLEVLVTVVVVLVMVAHLRSALVISATLPLAVLMTFIAMKGFGVDANIVALSGIAIAIGTVVDMGIVVAENIHKRLLAAPPGQPRLRTIHLASSEVGSAVLTAVLTTVVGFLPVFAMTGREGKLFTPLAFTKTFALIASVVVALTVIPPVLAMLTPTERWSGKWRAILSWGAVVLGALVLWLDPPWIGLVLIVVGGYHLLEPRLASWLAGGVLRLATLGLALLVAVYLSRVWQPLGPGAGAGVNLMFVVVLVGGLLGGFKILEWIYGPMLAWCLRHKLLFLTLPTALVALGFAIWLGPEKLFGPLPTKSDAMAMSAQEVQALAPVERFKHGAARHRVFDARGRSESWRELTEDPRSTDMDLLKWSAAQSWGGLGKEFMPAFDEGSFLFMPSVMFHASIGEALEVLQTQDMAITAIPEVESVVGKIGRAESPLDPAPISMIETVINYKNEFAMDSEGRLVRQWRDEIRSPDDIWDEIKRVTKMPGVTGVSKLQPIETRLVMLQSGLRAPMGVKIKGPDLQTIEAAGLAIEGALKGAPSVDPDTVFFERIEGKPYLEIDIDRRAIARYGLNVAQVQEVIQVAIGGKTLTHTVEGRQRYPIRVRYQRERRDSIEKLERILVAAPDGAQIPLTQLATIVYTRGPQKISSEDTFLTGYIPFNKLPGVAEVEAVEDARAHLDALVESGQLNLAGVDYEFVGSYEDNVRASKTLALILPVALFVIVVILYLQFHSVVTTLIVF
ncbi:MAG: efflux RND transporter permease subunit, partial [Planctomycetota bacterium]